MTNCIFHSEGCHSYMEVELFLGFEITSPNHIDHLSENNYCGLVAWWLKAVFQMTCLIQTANRNKLLERVLYSFIIFCVDMRFDFTVTCNCTAPVYALFDYLLHKVVVVSLFFLLSDKLNPSVYVRLTSMSLFQ